MKTYKSIFAESFDILDSIPKEEEFDALIKAGFEALQRIKKYRKVLLEMSDKKQEPFWEALSALNTTRHLPII